MLASGPIVGVLAGLASGGRLSRLADLRIRWWFVLVLAVALRVAASQAGSWAVAVYVVAFAGVAAVATANLAVPGMALIALGSMLNLIVVAVNGGMPVDAAAVAVAGGRMPADALHIRLTDATALAVLSDRIPVRLFGAAYSVGDVLLTGGGFWIPFAWMRRA